MRQSSPDRSTRSTLSRAILFACAIAVGSIALACGSDEPTAPPPAAAPAEPVAPVPGAEAPTAATPAPAAEEGEEAAPDVVVTEGALPEGFPSDVPVYPGADIGSSMTTPGLGIFSTFDTKDQVDAILAHYRSELAKNGWSVVDSPQGDGVDGTKGERTVKMRARRAEDDHTEIAITVTGT
jgi:hypothetical protein